jgi:hypothetical protein
MFNVKGQYLENLIVKQTKPVDQNCLNFIEKKNSTMSESCEFFKCFEERFPCGEQYWAMNWGYKYCRRYADPTFYSKFNADGQKLLNHINKCLPKAFAKFYKTRKTQNCKRLQTEAFTEQGKCYSKVQKLFCSAFPKNKKLFVEVLDQTDFFNMESVSMLKKIAEKCTPKIDLAAMMFTDE